MLSVSSGRYRRFSSYADRGRNRHKREQCATGSRVRGPCNKPNNPVLRIWHHLRRRHECGRGLDCWGLEGDLSLSAAGHQHPRVRLPTGFGGKCPAQGIASPTGTAHALLPGSPTEHGAWSGGAPSSLGHCRLRRHFRGIPACIGLTLKPNLPGRSDEVGKIAPPFARTVAQGACASPSGSGHWMPSKWSNQSGPPPRRARVASCLARSLNPLRYHG